MRRQPIAIASEFGSGPGPNGDSTGLLQGLINRAFLRATTNSRHYAKIKLPEKLFRCSSQVRLWDTCRSQLRIPSHSGQSYTLEIIGASPPPGAGNPPGGVIQDGTVIESTLTGVTYSSGEAPALLAVDKASGGFSNVYVKFRNITFRTPDATSLGALNLRYALRTGGDDVRLDTNINPISMSAGSQPSNHAVGLWLPGQGNYAFQVWRNVYVMGYGAGAILGEHAHLEGFTSFYANRVALASVGGHEFHSIRIVHMNAEHNNWVASGYNLTTGSAVPSGQWILDGHIDIEDADGTFPAWTQPAGHFRDGGGPAFKGRISYARTLANVGDQTGITVSGATGVTFTDLKA